MIKPKKADYLLLSAIVILTIFGVIMVYNASVFEAFRIFSDKYYFLKNQFIWAVIGLILMSVASKIPLELVKRLSFPSLIISLFLLIIVLIPGIGTKVMGARRWINLGSFTLQPTELVKLALTVYLAAWLAKQKPLLPFLGLLGLIGGLIMLQPDLGTTIIISFTAVATYYLSGAPILTFLFIGLFGFVSGLGFIFSSSYRKERLLTFFNPSRDPLGSSYHIQQALIAIGSGGLWGLGLGQSRQKYQFLPQVTTDSIFAIIAEELGFIGSSLVIFLLVFIILRTFKVARYAPDNFTRLLTAGIGCWLGIQSLINIAAMVSLLPLTGVPLPFISYGGSSLIVSLTAMGLVLNISRYQVKRI